MQVSSRVFSLSLFARSHEDRLASRDHGGELFIADLEQDRLLALENMERTANAAAKRLPESSDVPAEKKRLLETNEDVNLRYLRCTVETKLELFSLLPGDPSFRQSW